MAHYNSWSGLLEKREIALTDGEWRWLRQESLRKRIADLAETLTSDSIDRETREILEQRITRLRVELASI